MTDTPFFSVIMGVCNEPLSLVRTAVNSILKQSFQDFEFLLILDSPEEPELKKLLQVYQVLDQRVLVQFNERNQGLAACLNQGIQVARGSYIVRMDADDIAEPQRLLHSWEACQQAAAVDIFFSRYEVIAEDGTHVQHSLGMPTDSQRLAKILKYKNIICHSSVVLKTSVAKREGYGDLRVCEDYELWVRLSQKGYLFYGLNQSLVQSRRRETSMTSCDHYQSYFALKYIWDFHRRYQGKQAISQVGFDAAYQRVRSKRRSFNQLMPRYLELVAASRLSKSWAVSMIPAFLRLCFKEPTYFDVIRRTLLAGWWRR